MKIGIIAPPHICSSHHRLANFLLPLTDKSINKSCPNMDSLYPAFTRPPNNPTLILSSNPTKTIIPAGDPAAQSPPNTQ